MAAFNGNERRCQSLRVFLEKANADDSLFPAWAFITLVYHAKYADVYCDYARGMYLLHEFLGPGLDMNAVLPVSVSFPTKLWLGDEIARVTDLSQKEINGCIEFAKDRKILPETW